MAKAQAQVAAARFMTEVAPPPVVLVVRRRKVPKSLDTIAEDDREQLLATCGSSPSDHGLAAAAAAWSLKRMPPSPAPERAGGFMTRDLGKYFSVDAHGCQCQASGWEGGHKLAGYQRAAVTVHAQELHKVGA